MPDRPRAPDAEFRAWLDAILARYPALSPPDRLSLQYELSEAVRQRLPAAPPAKAEAAPRTPRRYPKPPRALSRAIATVNYLRDCVANAIIKRDREQATQDGIVLAPALRKQRGRSDFALPKRWRHASGLIHEPAFLLPVLDGHCAQRLRDWARVRSPGEAARPTSASSIVSLMTCSSVPGARLSAPSESFRSWSELFIGWCLVLLDVTSDDVVPFIHAIENADLLSGMSPRERALVSAVSRTARTAPRWLHRIRRCEYDRCYRYFIDASPTWRTNPARGCQDTNHNVLIAKRLGARARKRPTGRPARKGGRSAPKT